MGGASRSRLFLEGNVRSRHRLLALVPVAFIILAARPAVAQIRIDSAQVDRVGGIVTIHGAFTAGPTATLGGIALAVSSEAPDAIVVQLPPALGDGTYSLIVTSSVDPTQTDRMSLDLGITGPTGP